MKNLKKWEMVCNKCDGVGITRKNKHAINVCSKCQGTGKVDWLENIVGKKSVEEIPTERAVRNYIEHFRITSRGTYVRS